MTDIQLEYDAEQDIAYRRHITVSYATDEGEGSAVFTLFRCPRASGLFYSVGDLVPVELNEFGHAVWFGQAADGVFDGRLNRSM